MNQADGRLLRLGVFFDGNFLFHVSNYYRYSHPRRRRISVPGLMEFVRNRASELEDVDIRRCQILDAHYFRARLPVRETEGRQKLVAERGFDDILAGHGVVPHYLPLRRGGDSGVDVCLALEALELAACRRYGVLAIVGADTNYIPLVSKINSLGARVMLIGWELKFTDEQGKERETITSSRLCGKVSYPILMNQEIGEEARSEDPLVNGLFGREPEPADDPADSSENGSPEPMGEAEETELVEKGASGTILSIMNGYGFIQSEDYPGNVFFHSTQAVNDDFAEFAEHDHVTFDVIRNAKGVQAMNVERR